MSFQSELDQLIEDAAKHATDGFVHHYMEDMWDNTWAPNWVREGNYEDGWICGDWLDGQHVTFRSPSTGNVPSPFWATDVPFVPLGDHLRKDLEDKPKEWHQTFLEGLTNTFAKWRSLPEESAIVAATQQILDDAAWQINWQSGLGLQVKPSLDGWLEDIEPEGSENYGQAFNAFFSRYGETRDILCNNLRQDLIDLAACGAADAAAIHRAKASALSLARSTNEAMKAAHPDAGHSSAAAAWDTIGLIASIVPAKGAVEPVVAGIEAGKGLYENAQGPEKVVSGEHPNDVMEDFWTKEGEFCEDFNSGMREIKTEGSNILGYLQRDELSCLPPAKRGDAVGEVHINPLQIENMKTAMAALSESAKDPIPEVTYASPQFARDTALVNPYFDILMDVKYTLFNRFTEMSTDLDEGRTDLVQAVQIMKNADAWNEDALQALLGF